jgi:hypothetical protein
MQTPAVAREEKKGWGKDEGAYVYVKRFPTLFLGWAAKPFLLQYET